MRNALLGHAQDCIASCVKDLVVHNLLPGRSLDEQLDIVRVDFKLWRRQYGQTCPMSVVSAKSLGLCNMDSYPIMHSRVKAAHVHVLLPFVASLACKLCVKDAHSRLRTTCIWALSDFFETVDAADVWLSDGETQRALRSGNLYCDAYQALALEMLQQGRCIYYTRRGQSCITLRTKSCMESLPRKLIRELFSA